MRTAVRWRSHSNEERDEAKRERTSKKRGERRARVIILGRASPLGPGDDDDNNNLNRAHLAYV